MEDFHTEVAAQVLRESPTLVLAWLQQIGATSLPNFVSYTVSTQETFSALPFHNVDSRPDMVIRLHGNAQQQTVFVESKIGSFAGEGQLARYMDHLATQRAAGHAEHVSLVFITKAFEADYAAEFCAPKWQAAGVIFCQTRWSKFHHLIRTIAGHNPFAKQLALFMEETRMNLRHRFRTLDLAALENFSAAKTLMDETLEGKLRQHIREKFQVVSRLHDALGQLSAHNRYVLYADAAGEIASVLVGYYLPDEPDGEVRVGVMFQCSTGTTARKDYVAAFRAWIDKGNGWTGYALDNPQVWCSLVKTRPMSSFLSEADHVEAIRSYLLGLVDETAAFQVANPHLPWRSKAAASPTPVPVVPMNTDSSEAN